MIFKNLFRRKGRTLLTVLGISIGVMAIIILGALADGIGSGYESIISGSKADLAIAQPDVIEPSMSGVDEKVGEQLEEMSEISDVSGMIQGIVTADDLPYFYVFGYPADSFILERFKITEGYTFNSREARTIRGKHVLLGRSASEALNKGVGDSVLLTTTSFRVIGIYETGSSFEDGAAVIQVSDAQALLGRQRQVSIFYFKLKDPDFKDRVISRGERLWPDLKISTTADLADQQIMGDAMNGMVVVIAGMAIVIGGVSMTNSQLMSVFERTREIGVLRAVGWTSKRVMRMILGESIVVGLLGGVLGTFFGFLNLSALSSYLVAFGANQNSIDTPLMIKAFSVVIILGLVGGLYPARRAAQLKPVEALRYEGGGSGGTQKKFPIGGMAVQSLWQRSTRTLLTLGVIGLTIGSILTLESVVMSASDLLNEVGSGSGAEIMLRQANVSDTSQSVIDEDIINRISALPKVESASGMVFTAVTMPETTFFFLFGLEPNNFAIQRYTIIEGDSLHGNRQIIIGQGAANALHKKPGDTIEISASRFKVVGIYETGVGWESTGGVTTLRDAQILAGRPRKSTMVAVKLVDSKDSEEVVDLINQKFPDVHASLSGEFAENLPDMKNTGEMLGAVSFMALLIGGVGIMNTMLMAVLERTREIGALRSLGWKRRDIIKMILSESFLLSIIGGISGIIIAFLIVFSLAQVPSLKDTITPSFTLNMYIKAFSISLGLGLIGGIYPALRASQMQPVEALRYE